MRRLTTWGLALVAALTLGTLAVAPAQAVPSSTLTVSVITSSGTAVPYASVTATPSTPDSYPSYGSTGEDGKAVIDGLEPGAYTVAAEGYLGSYRYTVSGSVTISSSAASLTLTVVAAGISGKVTFAGAPVKNTTVLLSPVHGGEDQYAFTDTSGRYSQLGIAPGGYVVSVWASSTQAPYYLSTYYGGTVREPDATVVTVVAGKERSGIDIAAKADGGVSGKVVSRDGKPVAGASVYATNLDRAGYGYATTDSAGAFTLHGVVSGKVTVSASAKKLSTVKNAKVTTGHVTNAGTFTLAKAKATGSVAGVLKNKAGKKSPAYVTALASTPTNYGNGAGPFTKKKSRFTIKNLLPGTYRIAVAGANTYKTVKVRAHKTTKVGTLVHVKGSTIAGKVRTSKGKPAKKREVYLRDSLGTVAGYARTNAKGRYSIRGAVSGRYTVVAGQSGTDLATARTVTVRKGHKAKANIRSQRGRSVSVTAVAGKAKVSGVTVSTLDSDTYGTGTTGTTGVAKVKPLGHATQTLVASDPYVGGYVSSKVKISKKTKKAVVHLRSRA